MSTTEYDLVNLDSGKVMVRRTRKGLLGAEIDFCSPSGLWWSSVDMLDLCSLSPEKAQERFQQLQASQGKQIQELKP
jgi:hypothetical protein